ncbi:strawberry notch C-terminal domain-containing protein [Acaryochloris marina]|uniref:strawberry notch C-terminal domain-containing protein n=1 Tax=Acaryochloris marina TaxID=155978 RepID=UPI001BAF466B|nr:strawberry notch C-terminal domain-containing protein [Acaryochloris marina]QUY45520.1 strawberry notch C-terminal domain-containing protein [Acaryochloris marina S15]
MSQQDDLAELFAAEFLAGKAYASIVEARNQASQLLNQPVHPGSPLAKLVDESVEAGLVRAARTIIGHSEDPLKTYTDLIDLTDRQPRLAVRSSTSVKQQAYSTPLPLAYLAANLAGITAESSVYEPSAGHGALVLNATPENCTVNELNPDRAADLRRQGFTVTEQDASTYLPEQLHDVVIANPPYGRIWGDDKRAKHFKTPGNSRGTSQIDQAISLQALQVMKPDGRGVLLLGGKPETDPGERAEAYNTIESRGFFYALYQQYNVTQHITVARDLYKKQGAHWPLDLIVIEGRGKSQLPLPAVEPPKIYESFEELRGLLNDSIQATTQLPRLPEVHKGLDAQGTGGPGNILGESANRSRVDGSERLPGVDELSDGMDVRELDEGLWGDSGGTSPDANQHIISTESGPESTHALRGGRRDQRIDPSMGDGISVGSQPPRIQRNLDELVPADQSRSGLPSGSDTASTHVPGVLDGEARRSDNRSISDGIESRIQVNDTFIEDSDMAAEFNTAYVPRSKGRSPNTLIPTNMAVSAQQALDRFEQEHGDIDEFVMDRLGYDSKGQMYDVLYAEQIDSLALAFDQKDKGKIFLNGDQTGNGKGRFGAANIIDAQRQGYIPIFVTQKPNLYASMIQDLADIGRPGFSPFMTDSELDLHLEDGRTLRTSGLKDQENEMHRLTQIGLGGYDAIFTSYNQLQTISKKEPYRRQFLRALASRAVFIFDEAHEAGGGSSSQSWKSSNAAPNRAEFVRELVDASAGTVFMSATATKNPAVMDLYARRTDAIHAVNSMDNLENTLKAGGIPLQQMMATQFVSSGNMLRRERTFENISFSAKTVPVDHGIADNIAAIMRGIDRFDRAKSKAMEELNKEVRKEAKSASEDNAIGKSGASSLNFTSLMHNAIDQGLLSQKAEATVQEAIAALKRGEKPLIAVANTMNSFIADYAKDREIKTGDAINVTFGDVLERYLTRSKDVQITDYQGISDTRPMTEAELGVEAVEAYQEVHELIADSDFSSIPLSSIDYMKYRLSQEGYTVDEITGRKSIINYQGGELIYGLRSNREVKPQAKIDVVNRFNGGELDVVILNRSGATGISLHASERFADQRPRHMIVAQAERDVNQVFQMLGRANRFGQVVEPKFTLVMADVPAEKRLGAMLAKKMASLNANTTAARDSDLSIGNVTDFVNTAGEEVVTELLEEHPEIDAMLSYPSQGSVGGTDFPLISRTTGRIPLLPIKQQAELYDLIETETTALIQQKEAMGENVLEADKLDLDARTIAKMEVVPADAAIKSEFTGPVNLEVVNAKVTTKPPMQLGIINDVRENLGQSRVKTVDDHDFDAIEDQAKEQNRGLRNQVENRLKTYSQKAMGEAKTPEAASHLETKFDKQMGHFQSLTNRFRIGSTVQLSSAEGKVSYGVIANIAEKAKPLGSPAALTNWKMQIITTEGKNISVPFSKINSGKPSAVSIMPQGKTWRGESIYEDFDSRQQNQRTEMQVFTGNLIKAYEENPEGKFINFTTNQGQVRQGLIMPDDFDITQQLRERPVIFEEPYQVKAFLTEVTKNLGVVHDNPEKNLAIKADASAKLRGTPIEHFVLTVPSSTRVGGTFFLNEDLLDAAQSEFFSVAHRMEMHVAPENLEAALKVIMKDEGIQIAAFDFKDMARDYLGQMLPTMEQIEENQFEQQANFVPYVEPTKGTAAQLDMLLQSDAVEPSEIPQVEAVQSAPDQDTTQPTQDNTKQIAPPAKQAGKAEQFVAQFLHEGGLAQEVLKGDDFHFKIKNGPYEPLVVEQHSDQLYLTHYYEQNGDLCLDSEMVFGIDGQGKLNLEETAVQNPFTGGELRELDREFGGLFAQNIVNQGFAQAALEQLPELLKEREAEQVDAPEPEVPESVIKKVDGAIASIQSFNEAVEAGRYLDQQHGGNGRYEYETFQKRSVTFPKETISKFREMCPKNGVDAEKVLKELGYVPPLEMTNAAKEWLREPDKTQTMESQQTVAENIEQSPPETVVDSDIQEVAAEKPPKTPSQPTAKAQQPQQETPTQQTEAPKPKPKPQAKPEDWAIYNSALKRGHPYQARAKDRVAAYQGGVPLDTRASIALGKDFKEFTKELNSIRDWYGAAKQLDRKAPYLDRIAKVGQIDQKMVSETAKV